MEDGELLERFLATRDGSSFEALVARHGPMVLGVCRHVLIDRHDAEDAFQATFLVLARQAGTIRDRRVLGAWLHGVAYRLATRAKLDAARRRRHERQVVDMATEGPWDELAWQELRLALHEEVQRLPEKYRAPIVLCYLEGQSHEAAARQLQWPLGTVKGRLARARDLLQARLGRRELAIPATVCVAALSRDMAVVPAELLQATVEAALRFSAGVPGSIPDPLTTRAKRTTRREPRGVALAEASRRVAGTVAAGARWLVHRAVGADQAGRADPPIRRGWASDRDFGLTFPPDRARPRGRAGCAPRTFSAEEAELMSSRETRVGMILALALLVVATLGVTARSGSPRSPSRSEPARLGKHPRGPNAGDLLVAQGKQTFRFDTFGDEAFWGGALRLHEAVATLSPNQVLDLGLKVDSEALPKHLQKQLTHGRVNLNDPAVTLALLRLNAVVGVTGFFSADGSQLQSLGIQCALCHSVVDDSLAPGVGRRLDGWANRDLNVGAIVAAAPSVKPFADALGVDEATVRAVLESWGPGRFDAELILDGKAFRPDGKSGSVLIPPAFGQAGINLQTWTGWGTVTYWNALVANLEMHGQGFFEDERLNNPIQFPVATANGFFLVQSPVDRITPKLAGLHDYQLSLPAPTPPHGSFDRDAAARGQILFKGKANCASCHVPPLFTEPGFNLHLPAEIGIDDFQANRSPTFRYRTSPLRGLWTHTEGGFYHDGRFADLNEVINHYNTFFGLGLTAPETADLVEYLKSL